MLKITLGEDLNMHPLASPRQIICALAAVAAVFLYHPRTQAAVKVVLQYQALRESVSVSELRTFADTGELSSSLQAYLNAAGRNPEEVRNVLSKEVEVNPIVLYQVLNNPIGELFLDKVGEVISHPSSASVNKQALRGAVVSAALNDGKLSLIEVLEDYPAPEIRIDGDRLVEVYNQIASLAQQIKAIGL